MRRGLTVVVGALVAGLVAPAAAAGDDRSWTTTAVRFEPQPGTTLVVDGLGELRGSVEVRRTPGGLAVINDLPVEEYLLGLAEVPSTWPAAALEAQVIAARTYAVRSMLVESSAPHRQAGADICATQACQVYDGVDRERRDAGGAWAAAVRRTAGQLLLYQGSPILAKYSSSNGGRSDPGGAPYLPLVEDPDDLATSPWATWTSRIPLDQVAAALPGPGALVEVNRAGDVTVLRREQPDGTVVDQGYRPDEVRRALNAGVPTPQGVPVPVPSIRFTARTEEGVAVLDGAGYGHLTGMSQYGALGKARRGMSAADILAAYYGGLRPVDVSDRMPETIRVAIALDAPSVAVRATSGRFRVRAGDGVAVAHLTGGAWSVAPDGSGVAVAGPAPPVALAAVRSSAELVEVSLAVPARVVVQDAGAPRDLGVLDAGVHRVPVSDVPAVHVQADAGGGRVEQVAVARPEEVPVGALAVARPEPVVAAAGPAAPAGAAEDVRDRGPYVVLAVVLLLLVTELALASTGVSGGALPRRRRPRPS